MLRCETNHQIQKAGDERAVERHNKLKTQSIRLKTRKWLTLILTHSLVSAKSGGSNYQDIAGEIPSVDGVGRAVVY